MTEEKVSPVILLDRVVEGVTPDYCLHGKAPCVRCHNWVHLGHDTVKVVESGQAQPLCLDCVHEMIELGQWPKDAERASRVEDHKRAAGPHEEFTPPEGWVETPCANVRCNRMVWTPPVDTGAVPTLRVCSAACAEAIMHDLDTDRD